MSDTPRTDKYVLGFDEKTEFHLGGVSWYVNADFARQLERELIETKGFLKIADEDYNALRDYVWFLEREAGEVAMVAAREAFNNRTKS
mgnify:CR=1 FL=1